MPFALADARSEMPDEALAALAPRDRQAFSELYHRYFGHVYRFMRYQAPTEEAQDLTAQVFFHAYRAAAQFRGDDGATYRSWLFRIAHNTLSSWRRRHDKIPVPIPELPDRADASHPDLAQGAADAETRQILWQVISELPHPDRELVELRYVEGLAPRDIARVVGSSDGALRVRLHRLHRRLRKALESKGVRR